MARGGWYMLWGLQHCCKCHGKLVDVCNTVANATENWLTFATPLQMPRKTGWRLQERCKCRGKLVGVCRNAANATENWLAFAGTLQVPRKTGWRLQECCKCHGKLVGVCRNAARWFDKRRGPSLCRHLISVTSGACSPPCLNHFLECLGGAFQPVPRFPIAEEQSHDGDN